MTLWYTARGAGLAVLVLLSLSTCLGALVSRAPAQARGSDPGRRFVVQYLHRTLATLGLTVLVVHVSTIVADTYAHVGLTGAFVPFTSGYRPLWVSFGVLAGWLFVVLSVLGAARGRMARSQRGARWWRRIHALAYAGWAAAILHGFTSGTDSDVGWVRAIYVACLAAVLASVATRLVRSRLPQGHAPAPKPTPALIGATR